MAVKITEQMYDTFTNNGYTEDDIKNTVNHYREQGMPDSQIYTRLNTKYRELAGIQDIQTSQIGDQPNYDAILNDPSLNPQQQAEQIKQKGEAYRSNLDTQFPITAAQNVLQGYVNNVGDFGKGLAQGVSSLGVGLGKNVANPLRTALGKEPLTPEQLNNTYGFLGQQPTSFSGQVGKGIGEIAPYMLLPEATPFKGVGLAPSLGNMAATGAYQGGLANTLNSLANNGINPTQNLKDLAIGAGSGALLNTALGSALKYGLPKAFPKLSNEYQARLQQVMQRRNVPLSERYISPEELQKYINMGEPSPSQLGVRQIDTEANAQIAKQMEQNIQAEKELYNEYRGVHSNAVKKYGSIENLKAQALKDLPENTQYGTKSEALDDYQNLIAYERSLGDAKYIDNKILPSSTREGKVRLPQQTPIAEAPTIGEAPTQQLAPNKFAIEADTNVEQPSVNAIDQPQANVPEMVQPEIPTTTKQTKLSESVQSAKGLPTDIKKTIKQNAPTYESMTNNDLIMTASDAIDKDLMGNLSDIMAKDKFNAFDVERTRQIAKRLNAQNTPEANETLINLLDKASEQASKSGQAVQAFSLWNNLTPEGAILKTNKLLNEYNKRFGKNLKLTQEQVNNITKLQETAQALPDGYDKDVALAKSLKYQQGLIPKALGSKIKAYRNISLLLNPKTLGRNVVGNALFNTVDTGSKALAVPVDMVMSLFTKERTRVMPQIGESLKGLKLGAERGFKEAMQGINTADVSSRYDLQGGKVFESKVGQAFETALDLGLRVPDRAFYNSVYAESLANQLKASGLKEPTTKMIEQAEKEALEGVFQNKSKLSDIALGLRQQFNRVGSKEFGLGDLLIPYAQTPANLAQQGINYSPLGLLKAGASLKGGNQRQASLDIARALVGTGIGAAGYGAVKAGQATGSMETGKGYQQDLRLKKNMELLGIRPQQLGDISYSQFQPASIPFSVGAATATGESPTQAGINTLLDLPFLQNYNKIMSDVKDKGIAEAGANFAASIPSQFVPTALGQVNQAFDNTTRETYSPNKLQQGFNVAGAKIPFVAQTLPERVNVKGEPIQRYESTGVTRLGDVFLNPTFINKKKDDVVIKEMNKLYQETGEIAPLLPVAQRTIKVNGEQKKLTGKEVNKYQKEVGKISYYLRKKAIESDSFKAMNSDEQIDYLNKMNKGVTQAVKIIMFNDSPKKIQPFAQEIIDNYDTFTK